jgi:glutamyl-tRNA(Gln) amidotransferase subunit D
VAIIKDDKIEAGAIAGNLPKRGAAAGKFDVRPDFDERVALLKYHPSMNPGVIDHLTDSGYKAIVLEGTGLGHVGKHCFDAVRRAIDRGVLVCMTSQCIWGRVRMTIYETGRDLLSLGVLPLSDMLAETALVKTMWVLANSKDLQEAKNLLAQDIAMEYSDTSPLEDESTKA